MRFKVLGRGRLTICDRNRKETKINAMRFRQMLVYGCVCTLTTANRQGGIY